MLDMALRNATKGEKEEDKAERRRQKNIYRRAPFELLGNLGWIPFYGDWRKIVIANINKGINKKEKKIKTWNDYTEKERSNMTPDMKQSLKDAQKFEDNLNKFRDRARKQLTQ